MVTLRHSTPEDVWLTLALETDPVAMAELGGPRPEAAVRDVHTRRLDERFWFVICADDAPVGTIGAWQHDDDALEAGWMVLPAVHGRGIASAALGLLLDRVRAAAVATALHAFPGAANGPSNRLCAKHGFVLLGADEVEYAGRTLRVNHWRLDLAGA